MTILLQSNGEGKAFTCPVCHQLRKWEPHCEGSGCTWVLCKPCDIVMNTSNRRVIRAVQK